MADNDSTPKEVEVAEEAVEKVEDKVEKAKEVVAPEDKSENGAENGDVEDKENGEEKSAEDDADKVCTVKRKSVSGDAQKESASEGTPEKKAKLDETTEAESNGEAEVAA